MMVFKAVAVPRSGPHREQAGGETVARLGVPEPRPALCAPSKSAAPASPDEVTKLDEAILTHELKDPRAARALATRWRLFIPRQLEVNLPSAEHAAKPEAPLVLMLDEEHVYAKGNPIEVDELPEFFKKHRESPLVLKAKAEVPHDKIIKVLDMAKTAGIAKFSLASESK